MKPVIAVAAFVLAGIPCAAHAQEKSGVQKIESLSNDVAATSLIVDCNAELAKGLRDNKALKLWKVAGDRLTRFGLVLDTYSIAADIYDGNYERAVESAGKVAIELRTCMLLGKKGCAVFQAAKASFGLGYAAGEWISAIPVELGGDRTLNDMWTDVVADADFQNKVSDAEVQKMVQKMIARHQQKLPALLEEASKPIPPMCKLDQAKKDAVSDILAKAKANAAATPITSSDSGLSARTDAAINAGRAGADGAIAAGNAQFISTMQAQQQQALQQKALQQQALQQQALKAQPASPGSLPSEEEEEEDSCWVSEEGVGTCQ